MYRNFICYRGGSSAGILFAEDVFNGAKSVEAVVGKTYYSLRKENLNEIRNFLNDPRDYLSGVKNFVMLLTRDFLDGFIVNGKPNEDSVTRIEIDEALKNPSLKFIPVVFPDFSWDNETNGKVNKDILTELWGYEAMRRIVGSPPIKFVFEFKKEVVDRIILEMDDTGTIKDLKEVQGSSSSNTFRLESTPSVIPKSIFLGREKELEQIKEIFDSGERILFLQGIGGIGKTQIAKQYAKRNRDKYDTIIYATYNSTIVELVSSQVSFKIEPSFTRRILDDGSQENDLSFFSRKLSLIRDITNERTLIIIDNFDVMDDEHFAELLDAKYKLLITTRCDYSRLYPTIKIEPLDSIEQLRRVFLENYQGYMVDEDDEHLDELIKMVNRHTYTIELIAQHMENSGQTTEEMIEVLRHEGIVSLNESVGSAADSYNVAYQNLLKMFKVFNLNYEEKKMLQILSLMPLSGVNAKDLRNWLGVSALKIIKGLENGSWIVSSSDGIALHPIIRDVVRVELPIDGSDADDFLKAFNETIKEEKSWHFPINTKFYYGDIANEIITVLDKINARTYELYRNTELLFSFGAKPAKSIELCERLFNYSKDIHGENSFECANFAFQAGWSYLFNRQLVDSINQSRKWFDISYKIFSLLELHTIDEFAVYGHLLSHICRIYILTYNVTNNENDLKTAFDYGEQTLKNAKEHLNEGTPYYSRLAVAYMQLAEVYIASKEYENALTLLDDAYKIMFSLFGEKDPDTLNVSSRRSQVLYYLGRYNEALAIGQNNVDTYTLFNGEINFLRFEQMVVVLRSLAKLNEVERFNTFKEKVIEVGEQLLEDSSPLLKEIKELYI